MKRTLLQLAHTYSPVKHRIHGWWVSQKLDGVRAFWDGGFTRGMLCSEVPFANTAKDGRYKNPPISTGLWSRYGKAIQAPSEWLDCLPNIPLDGELWYGPGTFQTVVSLTSQLNADWAQWSNIKYMCFDIVPLDRIFMPGELIETNYRTTFDSSIYQWALSASQGKIQDVPFGLTFEFSYYRLLLLEDIYGHQFSPFNVVKHRQIPRQPEAIKQHLNEQLNDVLDQEGEGLILRHHTAQWTPRRVHEMLKIKPTAFDEATIVGWTWGRLTDRGSKHLGKIGALICDYKGQRLEIAGLNDEEREVIMFDQFGDKLTAAMNNQGKDIDTNCFESPYFPLGTKINFRYCSHLTNNGLPKEARLHRSML